MFFVSMVVIGLIASVRLPLESFPEATVPFFFVQLPYPGSTPEEVERNLAIAASEARERIDAIRDQLPDDFRRYFVFRWSTSDQEAMSLRLTSDVDLTGRGELIDRNLKRRL